MPDLTNSELRDIILGKTTYKKCPGCDQNGREYWEETGTVVLPYPLATWISHDSGLCQSCDGLGYIQNSST